MSVHLKIRLRGVWVDFIIVDEITGQCKDTYPLDQWFDDSETVYGKYITSEWCFGIDWCHVHASKHTLDAIECIIDDTINKKL
jgi:hypothetical protein